MNLGIIGGGQLGMMMAEEAAKLGVATTVLDPSPNPPAALFARHVRGDYDDAGMLQELGCADLLTFEFENVPVEGLTRLGADWLDKLSPSVKALEVSQDRLAEKDCFQKLAIPTAQYEAVSSLEELRTAIKVIGGDGILKTRRLGYDGKGQVRLNESSDLAVAWQAVGEVPCILEKVVPFETEVSVLLACTRTQEYRRYSLSENSHEEGILRVAKQANQDLDDRLGDQAGKLAMRLAKELDYIGVLAVEFFVVGGELVANEFAPRVHNSGHWTLGGDLCSQFSNHVRAVCGLPLGNTKSDLEYAMVNLIGTHPPLADILAHTSQYEGISLYLYHKSPRPGRKLGHINIVAQSEQDLEVKTKFCMDFLDSGKS